MQRRPRRRGSTEIGIGPLQPDGEALQRVAPVDEQIDRRPDRDIGAHGRIEGDQRAFHRVVQARVGWMMRSRIGLPYFTSPIWK